VGLLLLVALHDQYGALALVVPAISTTRS
jgi:hypothetical protein